ncbi:unnamed protein product [Arctogadus glacialis]
MGRILSDARVSAGTDVRYRQVPGGEVCMEIRGLLPSLSNSAHGAGAYPRHAIPAWNPIFGKSTCLLDAYQVQASKLRRKALLYESRNPTL